MPSVEKLIQKMKTQPSGIRPEEAEKVLRHRGFSKERQTGSHRHYRAKSGEVITIPLANPLKPVYIAEILNRIGEKKS